MGRAAQPAPDKERRRLGALGLLALSLPEEYGGGGRPLIDALIVMEEPAKASPLAAWPVFEASTAPARVIDLFGTEEQKKRILPSVAAGESTIAVSISEPDAGSAATDVSTTARIEGDEVVINGSKRWCPSRASSAEGVPEMSTAQLTSSARSRISPTTSPQGRLPEAVHRVLHRTARQLDDVAGDRSDRAGPHGPLCAGAQAVRRGDCRVPTGAGRPGRRGDAGRGSPAAHLSGRGDRLSGRAVGARGIDRQVQQRDGEEGLRPGHAVARGYGYAGEYEIERLHRDSHGWALAGGTTAMQRTRIASEYLGRRFDQRA